MSNAKNKWKEVAEAKQISKCLVIKWNKARDKIVAEVARNKRKANAGGVREARLRRKMIAKRPETVKDTRLKKNQFSQNSSSGERKGAKSPNCGLNQR